MKVRAKRLGFYGLRRRREGDVFDLVDSKHFSDKWMEKVKGKPGRPKKDAKDPKGAPEPEGDKGPTGNQDVM